MKRSECDEIRTLKSKQLQAGLKDEHFRQMEEKVCRERHRLVNVSLIQKLINFFSLFLLFF